MNKNIIRTFFLTLGTIFAMLLLIAGIGGYFITGTAPTDEWPWVNPTDEAAARLDKKVEALEREIDEAQEGRKLTLEITQEEATSKLDQLARAGDLSIEIHYIQIHFSDGMVRALAKVDMVIGVQAALEAKIGVKDGRPDVTIESLHLGRLPIPKALVDNVMTALEQALVERWESLHVELQSIIFEQGAINITLVKNTLRPSAKQ